MYKCAVIGLGSIGLRSIDSHCCAYRDCDQTELVATCDTDWTPQDCFRYDFQKKYNSYMEMVSVEELDIVSVCTSVETHCQIVCDIAPFVKAIYSEKPIAPTLKEADKMIEICHKYGVILQVNHQRRFVKPKMRWSRGLLNNGTHAFDLIRQLDLVDKVDMEYIDSMDYPPIFELQITQEQMILKGVEHLVECLKAGKESISSGEEARETLKAVLDYERNRQNSQ